MFVFILVPHNISLYCNAMLGVRKEMLEGPSFAPRAHLEGLKLPASFQLPAPRGGHTGRVGARDEDRGGVLRGHVAYHAYDLAGLTPGTPYCLPEVWCSGPKCSRDSSQFPWLPAVSRTRRTRSAKLSNSCPRRLLEFLQRATFPSRKSNIKPASGKASAVHR